MVLAFIRHGEFSVASTRAFINGKNVPASSTLTRRIHVVPIKINIFVWRLFLDKLLTDPSRKSCLSIPSLLCHLCDVGLETTSHLFFECLFALKVRSHISRW